MKVAGRSEGKPAGLSRADPERSPGGLREVGCAGTRRLTCAPAPGGKITRPPGGGPGRFPQAAPMHRRRVWRCSIFALGKGFRCVLKKHAGGGRTPGAAGFRQRRARGRWARLVLGAGGASARSDLSRLLSLREGRLVPFHMMLWRPGCFVLNCYLLSK